MKTEEQFKEKVLQIVAALEAEPKRVPFSQPGSELFVTLLMNKDHFLNKPIDYSELKDNKELKDPAVAMLMSVVYSKQAMFKMKVAPSVGIMLSDIYESPGNIVIALAWIYVTACKKGRTEITLDTMTEAFPFGFYNQESMRRIWDVQKGNVPEIDNVLDRSEFYTIIKDL